MSRQEYLPRDTQVVVDREVRMGAALVDSTKYGPMSLSMALRGGHLSTEQGTVRVSVTLAGGLNAGCGVWWSTRRRAYVFEPRNVMIQEEV